MKLGNDKLIDGVLLSGFALVIIGCSYWSNALAFIVAGVFMAVGALLVRLKQ